jgi:peptidoglycan hydrolase CwlO-like protein
MKFVSKMKNNKSSEEKIRRAKKSVAGAIEMFTTAQNRIAEANSSLDETVNSLQGEINELQALHDKAHEDISRNEKLKKKLDDFINVD